MASLLDELIPDPPEEPEHIEFDDIQYIHLKDAFVYHGNSSIPTSGTGVYWRGRIDRVDGFIFGKLGPGVK